MLEAMRRNSRGTIIYALFGILIAVFIINFGPGSGMGGGGGETSDYAAQVQGTNVSESEFRLYYLATGGDSFDGQLARRFRVRERIMDKVIERELLAHEAEKLGFRVSTQEAEDLVRTGRMILLGNERAWSSADEYDYKKLQRFCDQFRVSVVRFIEIQQRELLANQLRQLMAASAKVTPQEAEEAWEQRERKANLAFVKFQPKQFEADIELAPADIAAYKQAHDADLKKTFEERSFLYKKLEKEVRARRLLVAIAKDEKDPAKIAAAQQKLQLARRHIFIEKMAFPVVAKMMSEDPATRGKSGDMGWHKKGYLGLGEEIEGKVFAAEPNAIIYARSDKGHELIQIERFREGDLTFEQVVDELVESQLRTERGKAKAKAAADEALAKVRAGTPLDTLFPKPGEGDAAKEEESSAPKAEETGLFAKQGEQVPMIGVSKEVMQKAFEMKQGEAAGPFDVTGAWVVVVAKERREPEKAAFEKVKDDEMRALQRQKFAETVDAWSRSRCLEVNADGLIKVNQKVVQYEGTPGGDVEYKQCSTAQN